MEILSTSGDVFLGGSNFDKSMADFVVSEFNKENGVDLSKDAQALARIMEACEKAKIELSQSSSTELNIPYITMTSVGPLHLQMNITRAKFEQLIKDYIDKLVWCANDALKLADITKDELDGIILVGGSCRIPIIQNKLKEINSKLIIDGAKLDLAVAEGAALQGGIITKEVKSDIVLLDVTPLRYGIETLGGVMTTLVDANTTIPCKKSEVFSTAQDNQVAVTIHVLQGNRPMASQNKSVGMFNLDGIMPAKRGVPQIEVSFDIDVNGILTVSAVDKGTGKEQHITIESNNSLSKEDIERMKAEAEEFAEADKKLKEEAETINKGDSLVFSTEKSIADLGDKLTEDDKNTLTETVDKLKEAVKNKNISEINDLEKELNDKWNKISERMYAQQPQAEPTAEQSTEKSADDNVQDATFEEV